MTRSQTTRNLKKVSNDKVFEKKVSHSKKFEKNASNSEAFEKR